MTTRRIVQVGQSRQPKDEPEVTLVQHMSEPYHNRACKDYAWITRREQLEMFGDGRPEYDVTLANHVIRSLGHEDTLTSIPFRDSVKLRTEVISALSRPLAYYMYRPQQYGHPRNVIAAQISMLNSRLLRVRIGHKLEPLSMRPMTKKQLGLFIDKLVDDTRLWNYAEWFLPRLQRRIREGYVQI